MEDLLKVAAAQLQIERLQALGRTESASANSNMVKVETRLETDVERMKKLSQGKPSASSQLIGQPQQPVTQFLNEAPKGSTREHDASSSMEIKVLGEDKNSETMNKVGSMTKLLKIEQNVNEAPCSYNCKIMSTQCDGVLAKLAPLLQSAAIAEIGGTRELTVGELLLGRRQQLTTLKRLKQRIQEQKMNAFMEQMLAVFKPQAPKKRRKYERTVKPGPDDARPIAAVTVNELCHKSWVERKRIAKRFDAEDFLQLQMDDIERRRNPQKRRRWGRSDEEAATKSAASGSSDFLFCSSNNGFTTPLIKAEPDNESSSFMNDIYLLAQTSQNLTNIKVEEPYIRGVTDDGEAFETYLSTTIESLSCEAPKEPVFRKKYRSTSEVINNSRNAEVGSIYCSEEDERALNTVIRDQYRAKWQILRKGKSMNMDDTKRLAEIDEVMRNAYHLLRSVRIKSSSDQRDSEAANSNANGSTEAMQNTKIEVLSSAQEKKEEKCVTETSSHQKEQQEDLLKEPSQYTPRRRRKRKILNTLVYERNLRKREKVEKRAEMDLEKNA